MGLTSVSDCRIFVYREWRYDMNLITIFSRFPDQEACLEHLEHIRWGDDPFCPLCGDHDVARKADTDRQGRWNCHGCKSSFNVLSKTIFQKTRIPLQKWFLAIGLQVNAKKSLSSCQLARDLNLNQKTAWYMQQRIRAAMAQEEGRLLYGIVEADETYVGGKPRHKSKDNKRGRGTRKTPVIGAVERGGQVRAQVADDLSGKGVAAFIKRVVDTAASVLVTDEYPAYKVLGKDMRHAVIEHNRSYADGQVHTNTVEGVWSLLKRAWYGSHHHYSRCYSPLFVAETAWKYNHRKDPDAFSTFLRGCMV